MAIQYPRAQLAEIIQRGRRLPAGLHRSVIMTGAITFTIVLMYSYRLRKLNRRASIISKRLQMKISRLEIKASRFPWQGYGWFPHKDKSNVKTCAPLNQNGARFGAGWNYKLGIAIGGRTIIIDLLFGSIRIAICND